MAAEAGVLGVPFVRFNDFVGRLGESKITNNDPKRRYFFIIMQYEIAKICIFMQFDDGKVCNFLQY